MKTTKIYFVVCLLFILTQFNALAQYNGGASDGTALNQLGVTSCSIPSHFYAYFGGVNDGANVNEFMATTCGTAAFQFAYMGGTADGAATQEFTASACGTAPFQFAYMGGNNDGADVDTMEATVCGFPAQFYAYFGGLGDGQSVGTTVPICPTQPPVASFTASATTICVGQSVTFTDTSTNIPGAWIWTLPGGTPNNSIVQNPTATYNTAGSYTVTLQAFNYNGNNTIALTNYINVIAVPTVTSTTPGSRCDSGTVTLQATASAGTLNWYDAPSGGNLVGTGTSFTTPNLTTTTTYYVETAVGSCLSARTTVVATVNTTPVLGTTTPASRCGTGNLSLQATAVSGTIRWFDLPTAGTLLATGTTLNLVGLTTTTTYYVEVTNGFCTSPRTAVIATINLLPAITSTVSASRCDTGTLTLTAVASSGTINWYDAPTGGNLVATGGSFTTPSLLVTTTYYVEATNVTCTSVRTAVIATVNPTPVVTSTTPGNRCDIGSVVLQAVASSGTLSWYDAPTGGNLVGTGSSFNTPTIATTTTFYVSAANGTCSSIRYPVIATVNISPSVTSTTPTSICSGDSFTIAATASSGTLSWYNLPTGGTLLGTGSNYSLGSLNVTTTFYVEATNGSCSSTRTAVEVTVTNRPTNTSSTPGSRCGNGTVVLAATFTSGSVNWYDAPLLGNLVGSGSTFVTPVLSSTTTYYAEATNGSCTSLTRTAVTATVNVTPSITSTTPGSRCGTGNVTLQAVASSGTLSWFDAATGGNFLGTGTNFTTPIISVSTTYYVSSANGTCTSSRTAVLATVNTTPTITSTTGASRCDTGSLILNAVASTGTLNWFDAPTSGNLLGTGSSFTTPSISITTTYYVEVENGTCTSTRSAVVATINPTPSITSTTPNSRCDAGPVTLQATASSGLLSWYDAPSAGNLVGTGSIFVTPSITTTTTYYVSAANGTCTSIRTAVIATVNSSPIVTSTIPASICTGDSFTISATASSGTLSWYNLPTGGALLGTGTSYSLASLGATTIYYVDATNGSCTSVRTAVQVTVTNRPANTSSTPGSRCGNGTVVLAATFSSGTVNWYDAPIAGNLVGTGSTFVTPVLSTTTTYYAEATNGSCTSLVRTPVTATVNTQPVLLSTTPASRCGTGDITLQASSASGTIRWFDAATGGTLLATGPTLTLTGLTTTTTFYVEVTNGTCTSGRTAVVATINSLPVITSTTPASRCDVGTVTLQAVASSGTLNWYDAPTSGNLVGTGSSFTTPIIAISTTYYVEVNDGTCTSVRTAVQAIVNATPSITATIPGSRCDAGIVTLQATATSGTLNWYDAPTGGNLVGTGSTFTTPSIVTTTTYYVAASNGSCVSVRTAVIATVNASPTITSTTPATICGGDNFTIAAVGSTGTLAWYNVPTGGTVLATGNSYSSSGLTGTTTFYVQATNGSCQSVRTPVIVTVNQRPTNLTALAASRCGTGSVTLNATYTNGIINWYDAPTGGNLVFTGSSFLTPSLSSSVTYYVEAVNGTCVSIVRTPITATINAIPTVTSSTPASRCGTGSVTLTATSSAGTLTWYNLPTGGTALGTGTSFNTPTIASTTIYYVEVSNGTCTSTRTAVTATIDVLQTITATTPASRCDTGTVTLSAIATGGTINWYNLPTGGTLLGTGANFTTPSISTTTTYYVEVTNGTCTSVRTAVTASITPTAAPTATANQTFCNGETVGMIVVSGANIVWYTAATGGTVVPTGTPIVSGTTYYASQTVGTCESPTRVAVTMTLGGCLGNEEFVANVIKLYPNPVIDILTISSTTTITKVEVVNMLGQMVFSKSANELETTVDMERYAAGTYIVLVSSDDTFETFKVIKK